jgi:RimJ/RimL family protein N-acetyltransferase
MTEAPLALRRATAEDADLLLAWANDPTTRAAGFHTRQIDAAEHRTWLAARLDSPESRLMIGLDGSRPVGMVRLDRDSADDVEVSISVAAEERGRGTGRRLLAAGLAAGRDLFGPDGRFVARIRPENLVSLALFRSAGFGQERPDVVNGIPCLALERPRAS